MQVVLGSFFRLVLILLLLVLLTLYISLFILIIKNEKELLKKVFSFLFFSQKDFLLSIKNERLRKRLLFRFNSIKYLIIIIILVDIIYIFTR